MRAALIGEIPPYHQWMSRREREQRFVQSIAPFAVLLLGYLFMTSPLFAQPTLELVSHNIAQRCPEAGKEYSAKIKVSGGNPLDGTPPYFRYLVTADDVTEVNPSTATGELSQGVEKEIPLVRGKSLLWICDKEEKAYPFQLASLLKDGSGNLLPIPVAVNLDAKNVLLDSVLCHGEASGIISVREPGKDVRYALFQTEEGSDPKVQAPKDVLKGVSGNGVFKGVIAGVYKLWVEDANQCLYHYDQLFTLYEPEALDFNAVFVGAEKVKCPGDLVERVNLELRGGSGKYLRFSWQHTDAAGIQQKNSITTQPGLDSVAPGSWKVNVIDSKGCEFHKELTVPGIRGYALKRPPTVIEPAACQLYNENEEISRGKITNITIEGGASPNRRYLWGEVPEVVKELTGQTVNVGSATPYELPHGDYQIIISESGCQTKFSFNMPYDDSNQPTLRLVGIPPLVCYGAEISFRMNLTKATLFKNEPKYSFTVLHDLDGDKEVRGKVINLGGNSYRLESHIYDRTSVAVSGVSTSGCIVFDRREIRVIPPASFAYDTNVSHAGILFNGKVIDSVRSRNLGQEGEVIKYKDSLALGVLEGTTTDVGFLVSGGGDYKVVLDIRPEGVLIPSRTGKAYLYELRLPDDAFENEEKYKVVTVSRNGYTYDFLRLSANLIYTAQNSKQTCVNDKYFYIRLVDRLRIPNVFTPNGDGVNDRWLYNGDEVNANLYSRLQDLLPNLEVEVFTRAGVSIWYAKGGSIGKGWDGTAGGKGGTELPTGTYYYVIRFNAPGGGKKWKPISGSVTIVR